MTSHPDPVHDGQSTPPDEPDPVTPVTDKPSRVNTIFTWLLLAMIVVGGLHLRIRNNTFGLPRAYHTDEKRKIAAIGRMFESGSGNPGYFNHPGFLLYTSAGTALLSHYLVGTSLDEVHLFLAGRTWVGLLGGFTLLAVFWLGRELVLGLRQRDDATGFDINERAANLAGLLAAGVLAVMPLAVVCGHYIKEDVPLTFWTTLTAIACVRLARDGRTGQYVIATALAAMAFSTKYIGALAFVFVLLAHFCHVGWRTSFMQTLRWLFAFGRGGRRTGLLIILAVTATLVCRKHAPGWTIPAAGTGGLLVGISAVFWLLRKRKPRPLNDSASTGASRSRLGWWLVATAVLVFLAVNPYALLSIDTFGPQFDFESRHGLYEGHHGIRVSPWTHAWMFHLKHSLLPGMTLPALAGGLLGLLILLRLRDPGARFLVLASILWYVAHEGSYLKPPPNFDRYMNPLLPLLCAALGAAWIVATRKDTRSISVITGLTYLLMAFLMIPAAVQSDRLVGQMIPDTRDQALAWCADENNIPADSKVLLSAYAPPLGELDIRFDWRYASYMHVERSDEGPLDLRTGIFPLDDKEEPFWRVDFVITSSFWTDRYYLFQPEELGGRHDTGKAFYDNLEAIWGPPVQTFEAPWGSYGYNNPTLKIYAAPRHGPVRLARENRANEIVSTGP